MISTLKRHIRLEKNIIIEAAFVAAVYLFSIIISMKFTGRDNQYSIFFLASGVGIGFSIFYGLRVLPVIFVVKLLYSLVALRWEFITSGLSAFASISEILIGWFLYDTKKFTIERQGQQLETLFIALIAPIFGSIIGIFSDYQNSEYEFLGLMYDFSIHYLGDMLGILILLPIFNYIKLDREIKIFDFINPFLALTTAYIFLTFSVSPIIIGLIFAIFIPYIFGTSFGMYLVILTLGLFYNGAFLRETVNYNSSYLYNDQYKIVIFMVILIVMAQAINFFKKLGNNKLVLQAICSIWIIILPFFFFLANTNAARNADILNEKVKIYNQYLTEKIGKYRYILEIQENLLNDHEEINENLWQKSIKNVLHNIKDKTIPFFSLKNLKTGEYYFFTPSEMDHNKIDHKEFEKFFNSELFNSYKNLSILNKRVIFSPSFSYNEKRYSFFISVNSKNGQIDTINILAIDLDRFINDILHFNFTDSNYEVFEIWHNNQKHLIHQHIDENDQYLQRFQGPINEINILNRKFQINWISTLKNNIYTTYYTSFILLLGSIFTLGLSYILYSHKRHTYKLLNSKTHKNENFENSKLKLLINNSFDGIVEFSRHRLKRANQVALDFFEIKPEHLKTLFPEDLIHIKPLNFDSSENLLNRYLVDANIEKNLSFECFIVIKNNYKKIKAMLIANHDDNEFSYIIIFKPIQSKEIEINENIIEHVPTIYRESFKVEQIKSDDYKVKEVVNSNSSNIFKGKKILLVEDNKINIYMTKKIIEQWGAEVEVAENGKFAVDLIENKNHYDLILMDLHMPVMDGFQATILIKEISPSIPVIALTADVLINMKDNYSYFDYFISKPFKLNDLESILAKYLNIIPE